MPIYEYLCDDCGHAFELLVRGGAAPSCPSCSGAELTRRVSVAGIKSSVTRSKSMRAAKKRDAVQAERRVRAQIEYEQNHED